MTQETYMPSEDEAIEEGNTMKYTTLPTKPGRYIDRTGDEWTLNEDLEWKCEYFFSGNPTKVAASWLPFTDAPEDDKTQRIDSVDDLKPGDLVYFRDDTRGYQFMVSGHGHYISVTLQGSGAPLWLCDALSGDVMVDEKYFDHAERTIEEPEWPQPSDSDRIEARAERGGIMSLESVNRKVSLTAGTGLKGVPRIIITTEIEGEISCGGLSISLTPEQAFLYAKRLKKVAKKLIDHTVDLASYYEEKTLYESVDDES